MARFSRANANRFAASRLLNRNVLAADQGNAQAQYNLGNAYAKGEGVRQNTAEAHFWIDLASKGLLEGVKSEDVVKARDAAASHLTATQLTETQARVRKWLAAHPG